MEPQIDQYVQVFLRNGFKIEGKVRSWSNKKSVIEQDGQFFIIQKTLKDVFIIKIIRKDQNNASLEQEVIMRSPPLETEDLPKEYPIQEKYNTEVKEIEYVLPNIFKKSSIVQHTPKEIARKTNSSYPALQNLFGKKDK